MQRQTYVLRDGHIGHSSRLQLTLKRNMKELRILCQNKKPNLNYMINISHLCDW